MFALESSLFHQYCVNAASLSFWRKKNKFFFGDDSNDSSRFSMCFRLGWLTLRESKPSNLTKKNLIYFKSLLVYSIQMSWDTSKQVRFDHSATKTSLTCLDESKVYVVFQPNRKNAVSLGKFVFDHYAVPTIEESVTVFTVENQGACGGWL